jgi:hypothetical protein
MQRVARSHGVRMWDCLFGTGLTGADRRGARAKLERMDARQYQRRDTDAFTRASEA